MARLLTWQKKKVLIQSQDPGGLSTALALQPLGWFPKGSSAHCEGHTPRASWLLRLFIEDQTQLWQVHLEDQWVYRKKIRLHHTQAASRLGFFDLSFLFLYGT